MGMSLVYQQRGKKDCGDGQQLGAIKSRKRICGWNATAAPLLANTAALLRLLCVRPIAPSQLIGTLVSRE